MKQFVLAAFVAALCACSSGGGSSGGGSSGGGGGSAGGGAAQLVTIDQGVRQQIISGWEATASIDERAGDISLADARTMVNAAVNQAGINRLRLEVRSGVEGPSGGYAAFSAGGSEAVWAARRYVVTNDNGDPAVLNAAGFDWAELDHNIDFIVIPMRDALAARGEQLHINLCYVAFNDGAVSIHENAAEYAEFALATVLHMRQKYGITPNTWEIMLEPDLAGRWDGARVGRSIVATAQRFTASGINGIRFVGPSTTSMANASNFFDGIASVSGAVALMSELSYHRYSGVSAAALTNISQRASSNGLTPAMLEWWFGNSTPDILFEDLAAGGSSFQGRVVSGLFTGPVSSGLSLNSDVRLNSAVYRAVRRGAQRIGATTGPGVFRALAFSRPNGGVVVALRATAAGTATIRGLPAGAFTIATTTASTQAAPINATRAANGDITVTASGASVIIIAPA